MFAHKRFDHANPGQIFLDDRIQGRQFLLYDQKQRAGGVHECPDHHPCHRQARQHDQRELHIGQDDHDQAADDHQQRAQHQR